MQASERPPRSLLGQLKSCRVARARTRDDHSSTNLELRKPLPRHVAPQCSPGDYPAIGSSRCVSPPTIRALNVHMRQAVQRHAFASPLDNLGVDVD